jgi:tetratricopeptide (TPR) repeat protein
MRHIIGFFILVSYLWAVPVLGQTSASLLDRLSQSESPSVSAGLIGQIWARWTGAATDEEQQQLMQIGMTQMNAARYPQAEKTFDALIALNPDFMEAWNKRATVRYVLGDFNGSQDDINEVLAREPRHFGALSGLGLINMQRGDLSNAIRAYEKVLQIDPFSQDARKLLPKLRKQMDKSNL